jgi:predicted kinase
MINAGYINSDKIRRTMFDKRTNTINEKLGVYNEMLRQTREAEKNHINLLLDATFYKNDIRKIFMDDFEKGDGIFLQN